MNHHDQSYGGALAYTAGLRGPIHSLHSTASAPAALARASDVAAPQFVFSGLTATDLNYDTSQYPAAGTFAGVLPPWLNDIKTIPADWQRTDADAADAEARTVQIGAVKAYIDKNVPGQKYAGPTTAQIIAQRYTQGMWTSDTSIFSPAQITTLTTHWIADDAELARQRLGGANPNVIKLADTSNYNIADWIAKAGNSAALASLQTTLSNAQRDGCLFVCDYRPVLGAAVTGQLVLKGRYLAAPLCFFTIGSDNTLMPQAIQISATDPSAYIFTPTDPADTKGDAWLLAKLWLASADQQWWFSGSHLFNTHTVDMLFGTAALNQIQTGALDHKHPLVILAKPYLEKSFNVNSGVINMPGTLAQGIYQKGGFCDNVLPTGRIGLYQVINSLYQNYRFDQNAFPAQMDSRGLNAGAITKVAFPYRDDGQSWWTAVNGFVAAIVAASYASDDAVAADTGLNSWMRTVQAAFNHDGTARFTWTPTKAYLTSVFSNLLFTCSVQHTAVNNSMFNGWGFIPNGAFAMQSAPPANAAAVSSQTVLDALPDPQSPTALANVIQPQISFVMGGTSVVTETLGVNPASQTDMLAIYPYATGSSQQAAVIGFWNAIWEGKSSVAATIGANQQARIASWHGALPVPNSVAYYYLSAELVSWQSPQYLNAATTNAIQI